MPRSLASTIQKSSAKPGVPKGNPSDERPGVSRSYWKRHHLSFGDCYVAVEEELPRPDLSAPEQTLVFLHGRFAHGEMWQPVIRLLASQFRCLNIDLPGYGHSFSSRDRGLSLLEHAHLVGQLMAHFRRPREQMILVGHDTGGGIAQLCALQAQAWLAGLVLIACSGLHEPPRRLRAGWFGIAARWALLKLLHEGARIRPELADELVEPWFTHSSKRARIRAWRALATSWPGHFERQFWRQELRRLSLPVLLLWGGRDRLNEPEMGRQLLAQLPDAHFFENQRIGHWPSLEDPAWVTAKLQEFAFRLRPGMRAVG